MKPTARPIPLAQLLLCAALVVTLSTGIRHAFGLWLQPITEAHDWTRGHFSTAMAVQNLTWGLAGPFIGWWADRKGAFKVLWAGALLYAIGLAGMALINQHSLFVMAAGVIIGIAQACTTYVVIYGVLGRNVDPAQRAWSMGITAAAGSFGQFLMIPLASTMLQRWDWSFALLGLACTVLLIGPLAWGLREDKALFTKSPTDTTPTLGTWVVLTHAWQHRDFKLLTLGYGVCGFQLAFIGVHLPSYLKDHQLAPEVATTALALVGLFNVVGSYAAGVLGQKIRNNWLLSAIYLTRSLSMLLFISSPPTPLSVGIFASTMGLLWLSTVPPTHTVLASMLGVKNLSMLGGIVFFSHQVGSFLGAWWSGYLYDAKGSYDMIWWLSIALGVGAAIVNWPIQEKPASNTAPSTTA